MKPTVLIIADFPNWAYAKIQDFIYDNLSNEYDIYKDFLIYNSIKKTKRPLKRLKLYKDKLKYQKIRKDKTYDIVLYLAFYFPEHMKINWKAKKVIKGIYTDGFPPENSNFEGSINEFKTRFFTNTDAVVGGCELITTFYKKIFDNTYYANGLNNEILFKRKSPKKKNESNKFIVGWTGNPKREFKGLQSHIIPAVNIAKEKYPSIEFKTRFSGPYKTLPLFYEDVDVVIIASDRDAGPSLFTEASLMSVPSISNDIGLPHQLIKNNINGFIVEKDIEQIAKKIIQLYEDRELLYQFTQRIRKDYLGVFNKKEFTNKWRTVFKAVLENE